MGISKNMKEASELIKKNTVYSISEAASLMKSIQKLNLICRFSS